MKRYIKSSEQINIDEDLLHDAMEMCGYDYDDIDSYDGHYVYNYMGGSINFDTNQETLEWLLYVDMEDADLSDRLFDFLLKNRKQLKIDELFPYYFKE